MESRKLVILIDSDEFTRECPCKPEIMGNVICLPSNFTDKDLIHEVLHWLHPQWTEREVEEKTNE